ncbi:VCBS repeat-containing protein [Shewanella marinintestina]|uniref:FG-GAP repeat domain-containing protein n=1 Tax=Shewanella marinintestina TaxID=190305 RepID=UPI00200EDD57|nr:VCBS repeat-containing protein [Shewanella marinintestina]MCL1146591.1 VCBS repeat-containing protein [Shewanella marinintestina]
MKLTLKGLIGTCAIVASGVSLSAQAKSDSGLNFTESVINAPFELTHPIIAADLLSQPGKELIAFGIDDLNQRWMAIYLLQQGQYQLSHKQALPQELHSFDITEPTDTELQKLYFLSQDKLQLLVNPANTQEWQIETVAKINSLSFKDRPDFISRGEFIQDLNGDKRDDILIHDFYQVHLLLATDQGFQPQELPIKPQSRLFEDGATYTQSKLYISDVNLDGLMDIVKIGEGELEVYKQNKPELALANIEQAEANTDKDSHKETLTFNPIAEFISVRQPISGIDWWNKRDAYGEQLDQSKLVYRKVEELKDLNNDGITDMVIRYTKSSGVFDRVNDYEIYLGESQQGKLHFPKQASSVVRAEGTLTGLEFVDIDNDNKDEVLVAGFDIGVSQIIGALLSGSIDQDVHLFKMDANGRFSEDSNVSKEVELNFSLSSGQAGSPVVKLADLNGDGFKDLILSDDESSLKIYLGQDGDDLFSRDAQKHELQLPIEGGMLKTEDLNGDGREDLLIKYGRQDDDDLSNQFRVLLAS